MFWGQFLCLSPAVRFVGIPSGESDFSMVSQFHCAILFTKADWMRSRTRKSSTETSIDRVSHGKLCSFIGWNIQIPSERLFPVQRLSSLRNKSGHGFGVAFETRFGQTRRYHALLWRTGFHRFTVFSGSAILFSPLCFHTGHKHGTKSSEINNTLVYVDSTIERLIQGLHNRNLLSCVNIMIVSDHGMDDVSCDHIIGIAPLLETSGRSSSVDLSQYHISGVCYEFRRWIDF